MIECAFGQRTQFEVFDFDDGGVEYLGNEDPFFFVMLMCMDMGFAFGCFGKIAKAKKMIKVMQVVVEVTLKLF